MIGRHGIVRTVPMMLTDEERKDLEISAKSLKDIIQETEKNQE